jgi:hypothetical protein
MEAVGGVSDLVLPASRGRARLEESVRFARALTSISESIGFKISSRGWAYILEGRHLITKSQFDRVESAVNELRTLGFIPVDFVAEESARGFSGVEVPDDGTPVEYLGRILEVALRAAETYNVDWWDGEEFYIQMVVEKIDLKTLFEPVCRRYHIPIATSKGWSSILQRAEYARRFREAEERGLSTVLLYCGDHDPDGLRISEFLRSNLADLSSVRWSDGTDGYDPTPLIIQRFGLNYDFIKEHGLSWIENLETGSGLSLADPRHKNHEMEYVRDYIRKFGVRKCEANSLVTDPDAAAELVEEAIVYYLGADARARFFARREKIRNALRRVDRTTGYSKAIKAVLKKTGAKS